MFLSSPEAKLFSQFNRLALEVSEANVFATIEAERKAAVPMHVNVPAPESGEEVKKKNIITFLLIFFSL